MLVKQMAEVATDVEGRAEAVEAEVAACRRMTEVAEVGMGALAREA